MRGIEKFPEKLESSISGLNLVSSINTRCHVTIFLFDLAAEETGRWYIRLYQFFEKTRALIESIPNTQC